MNEKTKGQILYEVLCEENGKGWGWQKVAETYEERVRTQSLPALPPGTALEVEDLKKIFGNQNVQTFVAGGKMLDERKAKKADDE